MSEKKYFFIENVAMRAGSDRWNEYELATSNFSFFGKYLGTNKIAITRVSAMYRININALPANSPTGATLGNYRIYIPPEKIMVWMVNWDRLNADLIVPNGQPLRLVLNSTDATALPWIKLLVGDPWGTTTAASVGETPTETAVLMTMQEISLSENVPQVSICLEYEFI